MARMKPYALLLLCGFAAEPLAAQSTFGDYTFAAPAGWTSQPAGNGLWIASPPAPSGERCTLGLWPMGQASGNLPNDVVNAWAQVFTGLTIRPDDPLNKTVVARGVAPQGWEYKVLNVGLNDQRWETEMNKAGADGWELAHVVHTVNTGSSSSTVLLFKRAKR